MALIAEKTDEVPEHGVPGLDGGRGEGARLVEGLARLAIPPIRSLRGLRRRRIIGEIILPAKLGSLAQFVDLLDLTFLFYYSLIFRISGFSDMALLPIASEWPFINKLNLHQQI